MRNVFRVLIPIGVLVFLWAVVSIALVPVESGDAYPRYSTLRADPFGAKVLYESLGALPGLTVERNYRQMEILPLRPAPTVFVLGTPAPSWTFSPRQALESWEAMASAGARVVFVFQPSLPALKGNFDVFEREKKTGTGERKKQPVGERWGVEVRLREATARERAQMSRSPRESAAYFVADGSWTVVERDPKDGLAMQIEKRMGRGSIVAATQLFRLSNEGLREGRHGDWIATLAGPNTRIVFDEYHHQVRDTASVGTLLRRYRLHGAVAVLSLLALLFIWRNATGLLPPRASQAQTLVAGWDAQQGLTALLERSIRREDLTAVALREWKTSAGLRPAVPASREAAVEQAAAQWQDSPVEAYHEIHRILTERK